MPMNLSLGLGLGGIPVSEGVGGLKPVGTGLIVDGDSRPAVSFTSSGARRDNKGLVHAAALLTSQRFDTAPAQSVGVASQTSTQVLARAAATIALSGGAVLGLFSTNDRGSLTAAQSLANISSWIAALRAAGKIVLMCDETPRTDLTSTLLAEHVAVRDGIRAMHNPVGGVYVVPTWNALASAGDNQRADASLLYDAIHANPKGGFALAVAIASVVNQVYPSRDVLVGGTNLITNGTMAGTGGGISAPALGVTANSWNLNVRADLAPATATGSKIDEDGKTWQRVIVAGTPTFASTPEARFQQDVATAGFAENDVAEVLARLKINSLSGHRDVKFGILYGNGGSAAAWDGSQNSAYDFSGGPWSGIVRTPQFVIPAVNNLMRVQLSLQGFQNTAMAADVQLTDVIIRKV